MKNHSGSTTEKNRTHRIPWRERKKRIVVKCIIIIFQNIRDKKKDAKNSLKVKIDGSRRH